MRPLPGSEEAARQIAFARTYLPFETEKNFRPCQHEHVTSAKPTLVSSENKWRGLGCSLFLPFPSNETQPDRAKHPIRPPRQTEGRAPSLWVHYGKDEIKAGPRHLKSTFIEPGSRSRNSWRDYLSFCRQKRQEDASDHKDYDHISKVPVDAVTPGLHGLNSHHHGMGDIPPGC